MILKTLYPNTETNKEIILSSSVVGIFLYFLLIIYQPFGTSQFKHSYKYLLLFPYAIITTFSFCSITLIMSKQKRKWTISSELFKTFFVLILISSFSYLYNTLFLSKVDLSFLNYLYMFSYTSALGFPVAVIYILARFIYLNNKNKPNENTDVTVNKSKNYCEINESTVKQKLCIVSDYANFKLEIHEENFVFAESADNYCILYFYNDGVLQKEMIRISLTKLLNQVQTNSIKKVHRSFIVNLEKVIKFKGNTSGYKISIEKIEKKLTISRNYVDLVMPILKTFAARP